MYEKLVGRLRFCQYEEHCPCGVSPDNCPTKYECVEAIETLESENATLTAENERLKSKLQEAEEQIEWDNDLTHKLEERAEKAEAELKQAVEDMKRIVDAVRTTHCDGTCCFACAYDTDFSITQTGDFTNECPGFEKDDCFVWRGAERGE